MDIMEEGNLMDRVRILLQRDHTYYTEHQKVIQENMCRTIVGGYLDFPKTTTFVASKIVTWWEESYYLHFRSVSALFQGSTCVDFTKEEADNISIGKSITPQEFVNLLSQSSAKVLIHLHNLSQEALDHADLTVLTGTIGTATLIRNTIWIYNQQLMRTNSGTPIFEKWAAPVHVVEFQFDGTLIKVSLSKELKTFQNMSDALAERLLDLHCRLISLYVLQDVECLSWSAEYHFFEGERSSFTIQMWWLYVQGTQEDLWNSMPPKMAERIFSGILNESLTVLTSRYMQAKPKKARGELLTADLSNILFCMFKLLPAICENSDEFLGCKILSNVIRDIHVKCHLLFCCFLLRGIPLPILYKILKDGFSNVSCMGRHQNNTVEPWIIFAASEKNDLIPNGVNRCDHLPLEINLKFQLQVLLARAQPDWTLLLKVARTSNSWILYEILYYVIVEENESENEVNLESCKGFLCNDDCPLISSVQYSITHLLLSIGNSEEIEKTIIKVLEQIPDKWGIYFNSTQIWNQNRPLWIKAIQTLIQPTIEYSIKLVSDNSKTSVPSDTLRMYVEHMKSTANCLPEGVIQFSLLLENLLPADIIPLGDSVLIQLMAITLYDELGSESSISEQLCRLESNDLQEFQKNINQLFQNLTRNFNGLQNEEVNTILVDQILTEKRGRTSLKVLYEYLKNRADWLQIKFKIKPKMKETQGMLHKMFYIGNGVYDQVLSRTWIPKWASLINIPLGLTTEIIQSQLSARPEFNQEDTLSKHDRAIVTQLKAQFIPEIKYAD